MQLTALSKILRIMRLTVFLLLIGILSASAKTKAQVSMVKEKITLKQALESIKQQTGYSYFGDQALIDNAPLINVSLKDATLTEALDQCTKSANLAYEIKGKIIYIKAKTPAPEKKEEAPIVPNPPPPSEIHGRVVDTTGAPLANAAVSIKGTKHGTQTGADGKFSLTYTESNITLIISYTGFETREYIPGSDNSVLIVIKASTNALDEVVSKGYYKTTQRYNTGSVSKVDGKELTIQPVTDPLLALEGKVPGLYIQQSSGVPGAFSTIRLRGANNIPSNGAGTLATLNDPLFIIDGVPFSSQSLTNPVVGGGILGTPSLTSDGANLNAGLGLGLSPFASINPNDIESIEVLKDADATAIYGTRGANGVVLITTKKAKAGPTMVNLSMKYGTSKPTRLVDMMNTQQYLEMRREAFKNDGLVPGPSDYDINGVWDTTRYTNWQKVLIDRPASYLTTNLTISGGSATTQFSMSLGYNNQGTSMPGDYSSQTATVHSNIHHSSTDKRFDLSLTADYSYLNSNLPTDNLASYINYAPDAPALYTASGELNWQLYNGRETWNNALAFTKAKALAITQRLVSNLFLSYRVLPGLELSSSFGYNTANASQSNQFPGTYQPPSESYNLQADRGTTFGNTESNSWIIEPKLSYQLQIAKGRFDASAGISLIHTNTQYDAFYANGFASDALIANPSAASTFALSGYNISKDAQSGGFARIGYNWEGKYIVNLTGRRDVSSKFGPGKQFGNFGSAGAAWIFSEEPFMKKNIRWLSYGKLRASYGTTGSDQILPYSFLSTYAFPYQASTYQGVVNLAPTGLSNPTLEWQQTRKLEAAIDLGWLGDRINLSVDWYRNRSDNQLVGYSLPYLAGFTSVASNLPALVQNSGVEVVINTTNIKTKELNWSSSFNISTNQNKLVDYPNFDQSGFTNRYQVGQSMFIRYVPHYLGVSPQTGLYQFATKTGTGSSPNATSDYVFTKPVTQQYFGALQNSVTYKRVTLNFSIQFVKQYEPNFWAGSRVPGFFNGNVGNTLPMVFDRWTQPGDESPFQKFATVRSSAATIAYNAFKISDATFSDASFIRVRNIAVSWELPSIWKKKLHLQNARFSMLCQNPFTFSNYAGLDPETLSLLPPMRTITGAINITF